MASRTTRLISRRSIHTLRKKLVGDSDVVAVIDADLTFAEMALPGYLATLPGLAFYWSATHLQDIYALDQAVGATRHIQPFGTTQPFQEATGSLQPLFKPQGIGNRPALLFDGTDDRLVADLGVVRQMDEAMTVFVVFQLSSTANNWMLLAQSASAGSGGAVMFGSRSATSPYNKLTLWQTGAGETAIGATSLSTGVPYVGMAKRSGTAGNWTLEVYVNGALDASTVSASAVPNISTATAVGRFGRYTTGYAFNGLIAEMVAFTRALNATEIANITSMLNAYYGIV